MTNPVAELISIKHGDETYDAIKLWCPGCAETDRGGHTSSGLHLLPVSGDADRHPVWQWNGALVDVTLEPSIKTKTSTGDKKFVCHSFLRNGVWEFLADSTHPLSGQKVPMVPLPTWTLND